MRSGSRVRMGRLRRSRRVPGSSPAAERASRPSRLDALLRTGAHVPEVDLPDGAPEREDSHGEEEEEQCDRSDRLQPTGRDVLAAEDRGEEEECGHRRRRAEEVKTVHRRPLHEHTGHADRLAEDPEAEQDVDDDVRHSQRPRKRANTSVLMTVITPATTATVYEKERCRPSARQSVASVAIVPTSERATTPSTGRVSAAKKSKGAIRTISAVAAITNAFMRASRSCDSAPGRGRARALARDRCRAQPHSG